MRRSEALRALSHQHHQGLFAALQLKRARPETADEARRVFLEFFEREGARHFRAEEELLLPAFARHTEFDQPAIVRVLTEHVDLRRRGQDLEAGGDPDPAELRELGERLESHIRHEERVLFPMIEQALPRKELERLGAGLRTRRRRAPMTVVRYLHLVAIAFSSAGSSSSSRQSCRRFAVGPIESRGRSYLGDFDEIVLATSFHSPGGGSIST